MFRGKQKKLESLGERKGSHSNNYRPFLQEHSTKIEQKMAYLKDKISQKKKGAVEKKSTQLAGDLVAFITRVGMSDYLTKLEENGIDSYDILKEVKQSELEEIGIAKGHALKIVVSLRKEEERARKKSMIDNKSKVESTLDESSIQKAESRVEKIAKVSSLPEISQIQTESIPLERTKKQFCLYCYSRSEDNFCSKSCQSLYCSMFERYENNLHKAEQQFMVPQKMQAKKVQEELSDHQEFIQDFDFIFSPQLQDFAADQYQKAKDLLNK